MYKLNKSPRTGEVNGVILIGDGYQLSIPLDPANTDYQTFKAQINADEAELQDQNGDTLTPEEAKAYVATLP